MAVRRVAIQAASTNLTEGKIITVDANGYLIDSSLTDPIPLANGGTGKTSAADARIALGVNDANGRLPTSMLPTKLVNAFFHASNDEKTVVGGTWGLTNDASQTDYDPLINSQAGFLTNSTTTNLDEIHFGNLALTAGTYKVTVAYIRSTDCAILEVLHGTTSIGTQDAYGTLLYNRTVSFTYSPTVYTTGNLRFRANGKNGSSSAYRVYLSRLEIIRTG